METLPLHPAIVHLPLALSLLVPLLAFGVALSIWRGWLPEKTYGAVMIALALMAASAGAAMKSGEQEEETVERVVSERALEHHEALAERFMFSSVGLLMVSLAGFALGSGRRGLASAGVGVLSLGVAALALDAGHAGGELVYKHGAANAYLSSRTNAGAATNAEAGANAEASAHAEAGAGMPSVDAAGSKKHEHDEDDH
ncbi:MAG: DUF2231 domain-containing protein [Myxococcota bacterium]